MEAVVQVLPELIQLILMSGGKAQELSSTTQPLWMAHGGRSDQRSGCHQGTQRNQSDTGDEQQQLILLNTLILLGRNSATLTGTCRGDRRSLEGEASYS